MATAREIKRRIKTSKNISQVTRAMEMVSAVKMKRAQEKAISGREYSMALEKMMRVLAKQLNGEESIFLSQPKEISNILLCVIAPKKGLCGPLIGNLGRAVNNFIFKNPENTNTNFSLVTLGKKSFDIVKIINKEVLADFDTFEKDFGINSIAPVSEFISNQFINKKFDKVFIAYTDFINTMDQKPVVKQFLPILDKELMSDEENNNKLGKQVIFEPNSKEVLEKILTQYIISVLYQYFLESDASEHSARMVAMKNAHESADDIVSDLSLYYNKIRQNSITTELADSISSRLGQ